MKKHDLKNCLFGKWTVLGKTSGKSGYWDCKCSCGKISSVRATSLIQGKSSQCMQCTRSENGKNNRGDDFHVASGSVMKQYKSNAKSRKIPFELTKEELKSLISQDCYYCGSQPSNMVKTFSGKTKDDRSVAYNGIDRLDNSKGYLLENCVPCCHVCNWAKKDKTVEQFRNWIKKIYLRQYRKYTELTPAQLIDLLFTTDYKCWWAQEKINNMSLSEEERLQAAVQAQEYNAKRTSLMRTIDYVLDFSENTNTDKTYAK